MLFCSEGRITLQKLKSLVEKMQSLPCVMNQLEEVQVRRMLKFYSEAGSFIF